MSSGDVLTWNWAGETISVGYNRLGSGPLILMLPALSSISTLGEMRPLQERLASRSTTVAIDWPGFGTRPRPRADWRPEIYRLFLSHVLTEEFGKPFATIAAGHAAGYLIAQVAESPGSAGRLCLIAPTWRGPLPTMTGRRMRLFDRIVSAVDLPILGPILYRLNVNRAIVRMMARGHVYVDRDWLDKRRMGEKLAVVAAPGARHASVRFVTGVLDPMTDQASFLSLAERLTDPVLVVYGADAPPKSKAEMEALAALPNAGSAVLPKGKLAFHEEYPNDLAAVLEPFLAEADSPVEPVSKAIGP